MTDIPATIVGRIVWGNPLIAQIKKDPDTKQPKLDANGQQIQEWTFGVAFDKTEFQNAIYPGMLAEATAGFPNGVPPKFSWKFVDGDGLDHNGQPFGTREGYAGCYVLTISTQAFAPPVFKRDAQGNFVQMTPEQVKTGDYVAVGLNVKVNVPTQSTHTPSLFVNPRGIEHIGYGTAIVSAGVDPVAMFGGTQFAMPAGATAQPTMQPGAGMPQQQAAPMQQQPAPMQQQPAPMQQQPAQQMPQQQAAPMQGQPMQGQPMQGQPMQGQPMQGQPMPAPAHDFVQNAGQMPPR